MNFDRVKREIKILFSLKEVENVIKLLDVVFDNSSQTISLVFEFFALMDFHKIFLKLNDVQIKMYLYELLRVHIYYIVIFKVIYYFVDFGSSSFLWNNAP